MIALFEVVSAGLKNAVRFIKTMRPGKTDPRESNEISPYGWDSCPIPGMVAVYVDTTSKGDNAIIGYAGKNQKAQPGESIMYSTDTDGALMFNIWLTGAGNCLMGQSEDPAGYTDNLVRYKALYSGINNYLIDMNTQITAAISSLGGVYAAPTTPFDISDAKIKSIKTT